MDSIRERPAEIEDRAVPGHWEGDLLTGANDTHIATLVERNTRFTMLVKIPRKDTTTVVAALAKHISTLPEELRRSLTWDQGKEMHAHRRFTIATNAGFPCSVRNQQRPLAGATLAFAFLTTCFQERTLTTCYQERTLPNCAPTTTRAALARQTGPRRGS